MREMSCKNVLLMLLFLGSVSCNHFSNKAKNQPSEIVIDFTKVDVSPSFKKCNNLLDSAKTNCFREEIHQQIASSLQKHTFITEKSIHTTVLIEVLISNTGAIQFKKSTVTAQIEQQLPKLDSIIKTAISQLPKIQPAIKRGMPVTTQYQLPIKLQTQ